MFRRPLVLILMFAFAPLAGAQDGQVGGRLQGLDEDFHPAAADEPLFAGLLRGEVVGGQDGPAAFDGHARAPDHLRLHTAAADSAVHRRVGHDQHPRPGPLWGGPLGPDHGDQRGGYIVLDATRGEGEQFGAARPAAAPVRAGFLAGHQDRRASGPGVPRAAMSD